MKQGEQEYILGNGPSLINNYMRASLKPYLSWCQHSSSPSSSSCIACLNAGPVRAMGSCLLEVLCSLAFSDGKGERRPEEFTTCFCLFAGGAELRPARLLIIRGTRDWGAGDKEKIFSVWCTLVLDPGAGKGAPSCPSPPAKAGISSSSSIQSLSSPRLRDWRPEKTSRMEESFADETSRTSTGM